MFGIPIECLIIGMVIVFALLVVIGVQNRSSQQEQASAVGTPVQKEEEGSFTPVVGHLYDFPDAPHPARLRVDKLNKDDEVVVATAMVELLGAKNVQITRFATEERWAYEMGFVIVYELGGVVKTLTFDWSQDDQPAIGGWLVNIDEIEVQII